MEDYVKRFVTKDGRQRVTIYRDAYAGNPRYNTDEPLHCEDWSRDYSIMCKSERESKSHDACKLIRHLLSSYGNVGRIVEVLKANAKSDSHREGDDCLKYDKSRKEWILYSWVEGFRTYDGDIIPDKWVEEVSWARKLSEMDAWCIVDYLSSEMIDVFADAKYFNDGVKIASYSFGYYGSISFDDEFSTDSEGICWLEKDEFLKYSGCDEEYWKSKTLKEIEWLTDEIEAWGNNEVYGFCAKKAVRKIVNTRYPDGEHDDTETEETEWEETDSCWGFYGELSKSEEWILDNAGFKKEDLIEE